MNSKAQVFKYIALGAAGAYVYHQFKENPRSLGDERELNFKANKLIDNLSRRGNVPPQLNHLMKSLVREAINDKLSIRDVTPKPQRKNKKG